MNLHHISNKFQFFFKGLNNNKTSLQYVLGYLHYNQPQIMPHKALLIIMSISIFINTMNLCRLVQAPIAGKLQTFFATRALVKSKLQSIAAISKRCPHKLKCSSNKSNTKFIL